MHTHSDCFAFVHIIYLSIQYVECTVYAYNTTTAYIHMPTHLYYTLTLLNLQYVKCMLCVHVYMCMNGGLLALVKCIYRSTACPAIYYY